MRDGEKVWSDVNRVTTMLCSGMIPPGNSDILHRFLLVKSDRVKKFGNGRTRIRTAIVNSAAKS